MLLYIIGTVPQKGTTIPYIKKVVTLKGSQLVSICEFFLPVGCFLSIILLFDKYIIELYDKP